MLVLKLILRKTNSLGTGEVKIELNDLRGKLYVFCCLCFR